MESRCIACSGKPVGRVIDGAFLKPVCEIHARLYGGKDYEVRDMRGQPMI